MKRALLIGSEVGGLTGVHRDVAVMDDALRGHGFTVVRAIGSDATADGIVAQLRALAADTTDGDAAVVYYSGHGSRVENRATGPGLPRLLQCIVPTDHADLSGDRARVVLAEELSFLQAELTARTPNVTSIYDCCHSARMSRDATLIPRALDVKGLPTADLEQRWRALREAPWPVAGGVDDNPEVVRVVACSADESAYEMPSGPLDGKQHGALTAALVQVLTRPEAPTLTWADVLAVVRGAVLDVAPQRPEVEGPADRLLFSTVRRDTTGVRPVRLAGEDVLLDGASLFGIVPGDTYALVVPGGDATAPLARATVARVAGGSAVLRVEPPTAIPPGTTAWPRDVALGARPAAVVPADHPRRAEITAALQRTAQVRVADEPAGVLATVRLDGPGVQVFDAVGAPLYGAGGARSAVTVAEDVRRLARATHIRELASGTGGEELADDVTVTWVRLLPGGGEEQLGDGEHLFVGDLLVARYTNAGTARRYVSAVDVGLSGHVTVVTSAEPDGTALDAGQVYELGRDWYGSSGIPLSWSEGLPADVPRAETVLTIVADGRIDGLRALQQEGVTQRGATTRSGLGALLADVATGRRDLGLPPDPGTQPVRYRVHRFDFVLHPVTRPGGGEEPAFEVDERPDASFRLVVPRGVEPPARVAVRLKELTVHRNRAFLTSRVRVDALVVSAAPAGSGAPFQAGTARFDRIHDGDRLPFDDLLVYEGPARRFLDIAVWVARDESRDVDLAELLAAETADPAVASALTTLAGLAVAAPAAALVAGSAAAVAVLVRTAARLIEKATGTAIGVYRTSLLPHERFGAGPGIGRHPAAGLLRAQDISFAFEVVDLDAVQGGTS